MSDHSGRIHRTCWWWTTGCRSAGTRFLLSGSCAYAAGSGSVPFNCNADHCGLLVDGAYTNVVIGRLDSVGTPADLREAFHWAKTHGYWKSLPASIEPYLRDVQLVTIAVPKGMASRPVTLFMLRTEYDSAPYHVGDLVRYAPMTPRTMKPPKVARRIWRSFTD